MNGTTEKQHEAHSNEEESSYVRLFKNRAFRLYITSFTISQMGLWFTYIASISMIEHILGDQKSRLAISILVLVRLGTNVLLSLVGGAMADAQDRLKLMIRLDLLASILPFTYLLALRLESIALIYVITFLHEILAGIYEPCRSAIIPMMVEGNEEDLKNATAISTLVWSAMAALGAACGGFAVAWLGLFACFAIDSVTFLLSAMILRMIGGEWDVSGDNDNNKESPWDQLKNMTIEGFKYVSTEFWGPIIFLKASVAIVYGANDVLSVSFSEMGGGNSEIKLGILFALFGVGCVLGMIISDRFTSMKRISSLQSVSIWALVWSSLACCGMGLFPNFVSVGIFTAIRSAGASAIWINSSILLQTFASAEKMGRVMALDFSLVLLMEAVVAYICGVLLDNFGMSPAAVSWASGAAGGVLVLWWIWYHTTARGAASIEAQEWYNQKQNEKSLPSKEPTEESPLILV